MSLRPAEVLYRERGNHLVTGPAEEPVTLAELKSHLVIGDEGDDTYLTGLITEARQLIEEQLNFAFISQVWLLVLDNWGAPRDLWWDGWRQGSMTELLAPGRDTSVELPRWPLASVNSIKVYDEASNETDVNVSTTFDVDTYRRPGRMTLRSGATWPIATRANNAIVITYTAGYADAASVPELLKRGVKQVAAYLYEHRGDGCSAAEAISGSGVQELLNSYKRRRI